MNWKMDENRIPVVVKLTILGYELNSKQNAVFNYLVPTVFGCLMYIMHFTMDLVLVYRHAAEGDHIWSSLTMFFMYLPVIGCFIMTVSSWEMWPESEGCSARNTSWFIIKLVQHVLFPIWSMWRYAEKIFWSIEAVRAKDEESLEEAISNATAPRTIEFYFFLKGYLHTIPQILLQLLILMHNPNNKDKQTVDIQVASILMNICIMASTTVLYQRFKTQKVGGKNYPWFKPYKYPYDDTMDTVDGPSSTVRRRKVGIIYSTTNNYEELKKELEPVVEIISETSSTSSDYYENPNDRRLVTSLDDQVDFPRAVKLIKAMPEDDLVGKVIAFFWWLCFLIARFLAIAAFSYFYPLQTIWILLGHFIICVGFLLYDAKAYVVRRTKALFFLFIGIIYIFCIIEFKKQFKKARFIYNGFFLLVFGENLTMCLVWWISQLDDMYNIWWFQYIFSVIMMCTVLSGSTMVFYQIINKPEKVVVGKEVI